MATSFRFPPDKQSRLEHLAKRLRKSKAQVVMQAIDRLYEAELGESNKTALDRLLEEGFTPMPGGLAGLSEDEQRQRQVIRERIARVVYLTR